VDSAATVTGPPLRPSRGGPTEIIGETDETGAPKSVITYVNLVSPDYFRTLRIPLLAGRTFRDDDATGQPRVSIVNEEFARQFGLGSDIVGRQTYEPGDPVTIVGMVGNDARPANGPCSGNLFRPCNFPGRTPILSCVRRFRRRNW
jgi:hypothetical protein